MAIKITPTKANLIKSKSSLAFSTKGYNLLDKKRTVLIQEIMKLVKQSEEIEQQITEIFKEAYIALQQVTISMGLNHVEEYALSIPQEEDFDVRTRSVMGVDIPEIVDNVDKNKNFSLPYGFHENNPALDVAIEKFNEVKHLSYKLAEIESTAFKLSIEIKKHRKVPMLWIKFRFQSLRIKLNTSKKASKKKTGKRTSVLKRSKNIINHNVTLQKPPNLVVFVIVAVF